MKEEDNSNKIHLGDGAYATYLPHGIWLAANHHNNNLVFLEFEALERLNEFVKFQKENYDI